MMTCLHVLRRTTASLMPICLLWCLHAGITLAATAPAAPEPAPTGIRLSQGEFALNAQATPPGSAASWQSVKLPDLWKMSHPQAAGNGWYRFRFDYPDLDPNTLYALYLSRLSLNGAAYLNGHAIGSGGAFSEPVARYWNRPLLFPIAPGILQARGNMLYVRIMAPSHSQGMLYAPEIDRLHTLQPRYEQAKFIRITLNQTSSLLIIGIGLLMLSLWWRRKQDTAYGLFGLAAFVWALQSLNFYIIYPPFPTPLWELLVNASFQAIATLWLISLLGFVGIRLKRFNQLLWAILILSPLTLLLVPAAHFTDATDFWHLVTMAVVIAGLGLLARAGLVERNKDANVLLLTLSIILLFAFHDWLIHTNIAGLSRLVSDEEYLMQFSAPMLFLIVGLMMTSRYVGALNDYEQLNQQLEQRVISKHQELNRNFQQLQSILKEQATLEERERIYQDLHDDLGAKLLTLVYRAQNPNNAELARSALQDLRDVVSRAGAENVPLTDAMADYRIECERRLRDVHIQLIWNISISQNELHLSQPQALNLGRIIREAVSNVIRHAQASQVTISLHHTAHDLRLDIQDNGIGLPADHERSRGRGLNNIQKRATLLGGDIRFESVETGGLRLQLRMPMHSLQRTV